jgi:hypothetical protein
LSLVKGLQVDTYAECPIALGQHSIKVSVVSAPAVPQQIGTGHDISFTQAVPHDATLEIIKLGDGVLGILPLYDRLLHKEVLGIIDGRAGGDVFPCDQDENGFLLLGTVPAVG